MKHVAIGDPRLLAFVPHLPRLNRPACDAVVHQSCSVILRMMALSTGSAGAAAVVDVLAAIHQLVEQSAILELFFGLRRGAHGLGGGARRVRRDDAAPRRRDYFYRGESARSPVPPRLLLAFARAFLAFLLLDTARVCAAPCESGAEDNDAVQRRASRRGAGPEAAWAAPRRRERAPRRRGGARAPSSGAPADARRGSPSRASVAKERRRRVREAGRVHAGRAFFMHTFLTRTNV